MRTHIVQGLCIAATLFSPLSISSSWAEEGVTDTEIRLGGVMDLEGRTSALGSGMKIGIEHALKGKTVGTRRITFTGHNDSYTPNRTIEETNKLIGEGVFLFAGNMGTPTAKVSLPLLEAKNIPSVGFYTGASFLREKNKSLIINYRASYDQETKAVVTEALNQGMNPKSICAYAQNDEYGMAGIKGVRDAFEGVKGAETALAALDKALQLSGEAPARNNIAPLGVYTRNTFIARDAYDSLKNWEKTQNTQCKLVVTVGVYEPTARFIAYALGKGETWSYSATSATSSTDFANILKRFNAKPNVLMTQVTPTLDSELPIVKEARDALGAQYNTITLEGYLVGKLILHAFDTLNTEQKPITRPNFLAALNGKTFTLGGLDMDFTTDNQASDLVAMTTLEGDKWSALQASAWRGWSK